MQWGGLGGAGVWSSCGAAAGAVGEGLELDKVGEEAAPVNKFGCKAGGAVISGGVSGSRRGGIADCRRHAV